ncbi:class I SAM-dependent methyltransferase [Streptomyces chartreusis]|uniref:class I SAM-dependent methyltransferase n=1 Tax=Streptomyces chartreusis TaxID=1969 RepID=UPI003633535B
MEKYGETLFALDQDEEIRLRLLAQVFDPLCHRTLASLGVARDARCLEVGAGSGSVAQWFCGQAPDGEVIATDLDLRFLERVQEPRLRRLVHDVTTDPFPDGSFDVIHARLVLSHLPQRDAVMRRMLRWLRPGGRVRADRVVLLVPHRQRAASCVPQGDAALEQPHLREARYGQPVVPQSARDVPRLRLP